MNATNRYFEDVGKFQSIELPEHTPKFNKQASISSAGKTSLGKSVIEKSNSAAKIKKAYDVSNTLEVGKIKYKQVKQKAVTRINNWSNDQNENKRSITPDQ